MSKVEQLNHVLRGLMEDMPEIRAVIVAAPDGLLIAEQGAAEEANRLAAMAATALGLGKRIASTTRLGDVADVSVMGDDGHFLVYAVGEKAILGILVPQGTNLGLVRLEAADTVREVLEEL